MNILFNEKDLLAIFEDTYESHFRRTNYNQSYLNVLMHYIGELGELSQCYRKGRGEETTRAAKVYVNTIHHPLNKAFTDIEKKEYCRGYKEIVSGSVGDELADCILVIGVLLMRLNKEKGFEIYEFSNISNSSINNPFICPPTMDFDDLIRWGIESAVFSLNIILESIEEEDHYMAMTKIRTLLNNAIFIGNELGIDLVSHVQAKIIYNDLRKD